MNKNLTQFLSSIKNIHFIGIGGVSMSALAEIMNSRGYQVTGSDLTETDIVRHVEKAGIRVHIGHDAQNIGEAQLVVYTAAIRADNPELIEAAKQQIPTFERSVFLGALLPDYDCPVGVAGTHGKTTTASMLSEILLAAELDPTILVGCILPSIGGNYRIGGDQYVVFESCEYADSFLSFQPKLSLILNVEDEHMDYFKTHERILQSFRNYANGTKKGGAVIVCGNSPGAMEATEGIEPKRLIYGIPDTESCSFDFEARAIRYDKGFAQFDVCYKGSLVAEISLKVPGQHNVLNALAAFSAAMYLGVAPKIAAQALSVFAGTHRRFEYLGQSLSGFAVVDDYAHHPTEIAATLLTAKKMGYGKVWCVFQPHTYTRTKNFFQEFVSALSLADRVILVDIYSAREVDPGDISSADLAKAIPHAVYCPSLKEAAEYVRECANAGDLVLSMGAGNIVEVGKALAAQIVPDSNILP